MPAPTVHFTNVMKLLKSPLPWHWKFFQPAIQTIKSFRTLPHKNSRNIKMHTLKDNTEFVTIVKNIKAYIREMIQYLLDLLLKVVLLMQHFSLVPSIKKPLHLTLKSFMLTNGCYLVTELHSSVQGIPCWSHFERLRCPQRVVIH